MSETQIRTGDTVRIVFYGTINNIEGKVIGKCDAGYDIHVTIPDDDESSLCFFYSEVELVESAVSVHVPATSTVRECFVDGAGGEFIDVDFDAWLGSVLGERCAPLSPGEAALVESARSRVDSQFRLVGYGDVGEPSNGALIIRLADLVEKLSGGAVE